MTCVGSNDNDTSDGTCGGTKSQLEVPTEAGKTYRILVHGNLGAVDPVTVGAFKLEVTQSPTTSPPSGLGNDKCSQVESAPASSPFVFTGPGIITIQTTVGATSDAIQIPDSCFGQALETPTITPRGFGTNYKHPLLPPPTGSQYAYPHAPWTVEVHRPKRKSLCFVEPVTTSSV